MTWRAGKEPWRLQDWIVLLGGVAFLLAANLLVRQLYTQLKEAGRALGPEILRRERELERQVSDLQTRLQAVARDLLAKETDRATLGGELGSTRASQTQHREAYEELKRELVDKYNCTVAADGSIAPPSKLLHPIDSLMVWLNEKCQAADRNLKAMQRCAALIEDFQSKLDTVTGEIKNLQERRAGLDRELGDCQARLAALVQAGLAGQIPGREPMSRGLIWFLHLATLGYLLGMGLRCLLRLLQFRGVCIHGKLTGGRP
jgi:hypothetical protein